MEHMNLHDVHDMFSTFIHFMYFYVKICVDAIVFPVAVFVNLTFVVARL